MHSEKENEPSSSARANAGHNKYKLRWQWHFCCLFHLEDVISSVVDVESTYSSVIFLHFQWLPSMSENLITVVGTGKKAKKERLKLIREALAETFSLPNPPSTADGNSTVVVPEGRNSRKRHRRRLQQHAAEHFATTTPLAKPRVISARNTMNVNVNNFNNLFSGPVNARVVPDNELSPRHSKFISKKQKQKQKLSSKMVILTVFNFNCSG